MTALGLLLGLLLQAPPPPASLDETAFIALAEAGFPQAAKWKYREVELATSCWGHTTHGWVSDDARSVLAWDGVIYAIGKLGPPVALETDLQRMIREGKRPPVIGEAAGDGPRPTRPSALRVAVLQSQAGSAMARRLWAATTGHATTPLQDMGSQWQDALFDRAVCEYQYGFDALALEHLERIESLTKRGLAEKQPDAARLLREVRRRLEQPSERLVNTASPTVDDLKNWVEHLEDVGLVPQLELPGFAAENQRALSLHDVPLVRALGQHGAPVAERLIEAVETDERVSRFIVPSRHAQWRPELARVSQVAEVVLQRLLDLERSFVEDGFRSSPSSKAKRLRERLAEWKKQSPAERAVLVLDDDTRPSDWARAAAQLTEAVANKDPALGTLRARSKPASVTELLTRRALTAKPDDDRGCALPRALFAWAPEVGSTGVVAHLEQRIKGRCEAWYAEALEALGNPRGLASLAEFMRGPSPSDADMVIAACNHPEQGALHAALLLALAEKTRNPPRLFAAKPDEWQALLRCREAKAFVLRRLADLRPRPGEPKVRTADAYARALANAFPAAPEFDGGGTQAARDAALKAMREWVEGR